MTRIRIIGLCLAAAFAISAVAAATASAEAPEIGRCKKVTVKKAGKYSSATCTALKTGGEYEWTPGVEKAKFTGTSATATSPTATLETVKKIKVTCSKEEATGEFTSPKTVGNIVVKFTGCKEGLGNVCHSGTEEGVIITNVLSGSLQWENKELKHVALDLVPESGEYFVEFTCGPANAKVKGSVLVNVKAGKMETKPVEKYSGKGGKQKPEFYQTASGEKIKDVLESKLGATEFEQAGQTVTNDQTDEEALEVNWFV